MVLALVAVVLGFRAMILVSSSISDPLHEVVDAMAEVERGRIDHAIDVYERSEIGQLQMGFNRMVAGLRERDQLRDLFGRHVGEEVVRRAVEDNESLSGDERDVAILFIDLVGSTQLAATREPHEVAEVLNEFFQIVVAAVDERRGLINKFQGDAALAVFGAPLRTDDPASAALATARALGAELRRLPVDFGIGVSAGPVFAGNIGAENRYEYTVVGDAVNEAARLADRAKDFDGRVLCSGAAIDRAGEAERRSLGRAGRGDAARPVATHADLGRHRPPHRSHRPHVLQVRYCAQTGMHVYDRCALRSSTIAARARIRAGEHVGPTSGLAPGFAQANLAVLPAELRARLPALLRAQPQTVPAARGDRHRITATDHTRAGRRPADRSCRATASSATATLVDEPTDVTRYWRDDLVAFLLGCSFTFEWALAAAGLPLAHQTRASTSRCTSRIADASARAHSTGRWSCRCGRSPPADIRTRRRDLGPLSGDARRARARRRPGGARHRRPRRTRLRRPGAARSPARSPSSGRAA